MTIFVTSYPVETSWYGQDLEAESFEHANALALARGLNERVIGKKAAGEGEWVSPPRLLAEIEPTKAGVRKARKDGTLAAALHACVNLCHIGLSAGVIHPREALGDRGLIHTLAHLLCGDDFEVAPSILRCREQAVEFCRRVPGWPLMNSIEGVPPYGPPSEPD
jgi:hypothetical protein